MSTINRLNHSGTRNINKAMVVADIKSVGLAVTLSRLHILSVFYIFEDSKISAVDIYKYLSKQKISMSLSTIYNALKNLTQTGLLIATSIGNNGRVFELKKGRNPAVMVCPICNKCAEVIDFDLTESHEEAIKNLGFDPCQYSFSITSMCVDCVRWDLRATTS